MSLLGASGEDFIKNVRVYIFEAFNQLVDLWFWPIIFIGVMAIASIIMFVLINHSYENRILKSINKLNKYFLAKPFITEENLVEFNLKMKSVPRVLRNAWQVYMLNREDAPTTYINAQTCIDKPLRTSSIEKNMSNYTIFTVLLTFIAFVTGIQYAIAKVGNNNAGYILFYALLVPLAIVIIYAILILFMRLRKNDIYSCLYDNFPLYERNLTKAVSTLPGYVDYEILFTKKEISEGIPILQQYLEKRALIEQQELEKARENSVACEEYDFNELGIDGSLVLERAMKECEIFMKTRRRLQEECDQIETEKENYKKNYETTEKDFQRKLQASRENLESLKNQQEASTNRIESNYIKKQQNDEIKKQQQLEKDSEEATAKFKEEQLTLEQEIEKRKQEIEEKKAFVQQAMLLEFKHYANTLYKALAGKATELSNQKLITIAQENADLKGLINDLQGIDMEKEPEAQDSFVQPEVVADQNLYEMTNSDEKQMKENLKQSQKSEEIEAKKEEEKKAEKKEESEKESQNEQLDNSNGEDIKAKEDNNLDTLKTEEKPNVGEAQKPNSDNVNNDSDASSDGLGDGVVNVENSSDGGSDIGGSDGVVNNGSEDDGGKVVDVASEEKVVINSTKEDEDINSLQKQIDEENANLQKQKQEFENVVNDTISKIDNKERASNDSKIEEVSIEEPKTEEQPKEEIVEDEVKIDEQTPQKEKTEENTPASEPKPRARSVRKAPARSARTTRSRGEGSAKKANADIDALNAEMEKLLNSTKN